MGNFYENVKEGMMFEIIARLNELEFKANKTARKTDTTRAQQMLLLYHLGALEPVLKLNITKEKKALLLSKLLNSSPENLEKDLTVLGHKTSHLMTSKNYTFLVKVFQELGITDKEKECQQELDRILKEEEKKSRK